MCQEGCLLLCLFLMNHCSRWRSIIPIWCHLVHENRIHSLLEGRMRLYRWVVRLVWDCPWRIARNSLAHSNAHHLAAEGFVCSFCWCQKPECILLRLRMHRLSLCKVFRGIPSRVPRLASMLAAPLLSATFMVLL
jgi:hypothetical protein